jgi:pyocin large subunit-like protein
LITNPLKGTNQLSFSAKKPSKTMQKQHFSMKKHSFSAKMVDERIQTFNQFEGLLHLKQAVIS